MFLMTVLRSLLIALTGAALVAYSPISAIAEVLPENSPTLQDDDGDEGEEAEVEDGEAEEGDDDKITLPLEASRTFEFETDEGTWMSVDVSPDGQTVIFDLMGDIYTVPFTGGDATAILTGLPMDAQPVFSPDGDTIAFVSDRDGSENIWIAKADGSELKKLTEDKEAEFASPEFSPDGDYVYVSRNKKLGVYEIWMYHVKGGGGVQITKGTESPQTPRQFRQNTLGAVASPDGRYIYYSKRTGGFAYNMDLPAWDVSRRDLLKGNEESIIRAVGSAMRPVLSPDGQSLVYATRQETETALRVRNLVTGADRLLAYPVQRDDQESRNTRDLMPNYDFTPDGREIVAAVGGKIVRIDLESGAQTIIPFSAQVSLDAGPDLHVALLEDTGPVEVRISRSPSQSPDGNSVVFSALGRIYIKDLADGDIDALSDDDATEFNPAWSPDGNWITYVTWSDIGGGHIWKRRANGRGNPVQITEAPGFYYGPVFTPDGERIVAFQTGTYQQLNTTSAGFGRPAGGDLVHFPADGGRSTLITHDRQLGSPHFSANDGRIFLYGQGGLISMRLDGTDRRQHVEVKGNPGFFGNEPGPASDVRISPDERWALAEIQGQLYVLAVPQVGPKAAVVNVNKPAVPVKKLTEMGADYFDWSADGRTITWAVGSTFYRQAFDTVDFEPEEEPEEGDAKDEDSEADDADEAAGESDDTTDDSADSAEDADEAEEAEADEWGENVEEFSLTVSVPRDLPNASAVLRGATVITMSGDQVIENADIVVSGDRIIAVGAAGSVDVPDGAQIIDVAGKTIIPGFVDTHAHWFDILHGADIAENNHWALLANLAYGVTAGLDVQTATTDNFEYQDMIDAGLMPGPRAWSTGPGVFSNNAFKSAEHAKQVLSKYRDHYRTRNIKAYLSGERNQRQWIAMAAKELGMIVTTEGGLDMKMNITHMLDGLGTEHAMPVTPLYNDIVQTMAQSKIGYTPTLLVAYGGPWGENYFYTHEPPHKDPKLNRFTPHYIIDLKTRHREWFRDQDHVFTRLAEQAAKIMRGGGNIGVGSHGQLQGLGYHWELWMIASGGLSSMEAIRVATIMGAEIIGREDEIGSIEAGKFADFLILSADPRDDIRNTSTIEHVMKGGRMYEGDTLNEVYPRQRPLPRLWFHAEDSD